MTPVEFSWFSWDAGIIRDFSLVTLSLRPWPDLQEGYLAPVICSTPLFIAAGPATRCGLAGLRGKVLLCSPG